MDEKKIKNIEKVDQALHLIRQRAMDCIISGKPATITCEIILVDGGGYRSAVVGVREKV